MKTTEFKQKAKVGVATIIFYNQNNLVNSKKALIFVPSKIYN